MIRLIIVQILLFIASNGCIGQEQKMGYGLVFEKYSYLLYSNNSFTCISSNEDGVCFSGEWVESENSLVTYFTYHWDSIKQVRLKKISSKPDDSLYLNIKSEQIDIIPRIRLFSLDDNQRKILNMIDATEIIKLEKGIYDEITIETFSDKSSSYNLPKNGQIIIDVSICNYSEKRNDKIIYFDSVFKTTKLRGCKWFILGDYKTVIKEKDGYEILLSSD